MNFSSFEYVIMLSSERSFTKAARQLHITQQSLSTHIASIEEELGCQLFVRHVPLELTYAGSVFLQYAEHFQEEFKNMYREFGDITGNQKGVLRIGIAFTRGRAIMPGLILKFQEEYPNVKIELTEAQNKILQYKLQNGEIDLAVAGFENTVPEVELRDFYEEEVVLLISRTLMEKMNSCRISKLTGKIEEGDLSLLSSCPFVLGNSDDIAGKIGRALIKKAGFVPAIKAKSDNMETLLALCLQDAGACFCPENLLNAAVTPEAQKNLIKFRLGEQAKYPIRFGFLKSTYQWKIISEFIRMANDTIVSNE